MDLKQQIDALQAQLDQSPFSAEMWDDLAGLYYKDQQREKAFEALDFSLAIQPDKNPSMRTKAILLILGDTPEEQQEGHTLLEEYGRQCPEDTSVQPLLAFNYLAAGRLTEAAKIFEQLYVGDLEDMQKLDRLIAKGSVQPSLYMSVIHNYRDLRQYDKALFVIRQLLQLNPEDPFLYLVYGGIILQQGQHEEAEKWFAQADFYAEEGRKHEIFLFELGGEYFEAGLYRKAYDTLLRLQATDLQHRAIPYLACCCLELADRTNYLAYLKQMHEHSSIEIKYVFRNHIPFNLDRDELYDFLVKIYDRCNPPSDQAL